MTALRKYARLETTGLWRPSPDVQKQEVVIQFGEASLVLSDLPTSVPFTHWSLAAVVRVNPHETPALYRPSDDEAEVETLEIDEPGMIEAIETVRTAVLRRRRKRGRGRRTVLLGALAATAVLGALFLPSLLVNHTASVVPFVQRQEIGRELLGSMTRFTGAPCAAPEGIAVLARLSTQLFGSDGPALVVLRDGLAPNGTGHVPGHHILIDRRLIESYDGPEVLAGHLMAERMRIDAVDPLSEVLHSAGTIATVKLLATGNLPKNSLSDQAQERLLAPPLRLAAEEVAQRFTEARLMLAPYAQSLKDPQAIEELGAQPSLTPDRARALLPDSDWLALQNICAR